MKKGLLIFVVFSIFVGVGCLTAADASLPTLTLEEALARVESHSDYQTWLANLDEVEDTLQSIADKHSLALDLSGNLLRYTYNFDQESSQLSTGGGISLSKSSLSGTSLSGNISPTYSFKDGELRTTWSLGVEQTLWPAPRYSSDQLTLSVAKGQHDLLQRQREYMVAGARLKIEDLYRTAQLAQMRVAFAETSLENAQTSLTVTKQKVKLGEASEADLISSELSILLAERELESSLSNAQTALDNLLSALDLEGDYQLASLEIELPPTTEIEVDVEGLIAELVNHPLVLASKLELDKAELELKAAQESSKPQANLSINLSESPTTQQGGGLSFQAMVSVGYPLLDRNQRNRTLETRAESLDKAEESYQDVLENVRTLIEEAALDLSKLARDEEIARLTLRRAELEWEAVQRQFELGIIEGNLLTNAQMELLRAKLDYWEACHRHSLAKRRLSLGIVGDLPGGMAR